MACKTTKFSAQKTIQRLEKKGIILRKGFKNGRSGWTRYELPEHIFKNIFQAEMQDKLRTNLGQTQDKLRSEPRTELRTTGSSSSSNIYINTTTTGEEIIAPSGSLPEEWKNIDIEPLGEIGFSQTHLFQIAAQKTLPAEIVQNSIYHFAFDLEENGKAKVIKGEPLNFFMGILRKGIPYAAAENYEHPKDRTMRLYLERTREIVNKREEMRKETREIAFKDWYHNFAEY